MKRILLLSFFSALAVFLFPGTGSTFTRSEMKSANSAVSSDAKEEEQEEQDDNTDLTAYVLSGTGLVTVGSAGAVIIAINNENRKKHENKPVKEYNPEDQNK